MGRFQLCDGYVIVKQIKLPVLCDGYVTDDFAIGGTNRVKHSVFNIFS